MFETITAKDEVDLINQLINWHKTLINSRPIRARTMRECSRCKCITKGMSNWLGVWLCEFCQLTIQDSMDRENEHRRILYERRAVDAAIKKQS